MNMTDITRNMSNHPTISSPNSGIRENVNLSKENIRDTIGELKDTVSLQLGKNDLNQVLGNIKHSLQEVVGKTKTLAGAFKNDIKNRFQSDLPEDAICVKGTHGRDNIAIDQLKDGSLAVNINGKERVFNPEESLRLVIDGGNGDDTIVASENVTAPLYILGGRGNDHIVGGRGNDYIRGGKGNDTIVERAGDNELFGDDGCDTITGGSGRDFIDGGKGADTIRGGSGNDVVYGGPDDDTIYGEEGDDFINGGSGDDTIHGGLGNDVIFGGRGNDKLCGEEGDDLLVGGLGTDDLEGGSGNDRIRATEGNSGQDFIVADSGDEVKILNPVAIPGNISIDPLATGRFKEHMRDNLEAMAAIEPGQAMFAELGSAGRTVMITSTSDQNGYARSFTANGDAISSYGADGISSVANVGTGTLVSINPLYINQYDNSEKWSETNSMVITAHELAHAYNNATGTMDNTIYDDVTGNFSDGKGNKDVSGAEFQAVRLHEGKALSENPYGLAENDYRDYLGMEKRTSYLRSDKA